MTRRASEQPRAASVQRACKAGCAWDNRLTHLSRTHRRRRSFLAASCSLAALAVVGLGAAASRTPSAAHALSASESSPAPRPARPDLPPASDVPLSRLVGQTLMGRVDGATAGPDLLARIRRGELGGVILFSSSFTSLAGLRALVTTLQTAAKNGGNPPLLIAIDQEGGIVKRLPAGPPTLTPREIGARGTAVARSQGAATGRYLRRLGIDVDLAPVLDVPASSRSFIRSRALGADPARVALVGSAFAAGLQQRRVAATAKHFPGLGTATRNTDAAAVAIDTPRRELLRRLEPFRRAVRDGTKLVMTSNASYRALDPSGLPAGLSPRIVRGLLRETLGFDGVVITDTMSAPGLRGYPDAAARALDAGVDVLLYTSDEAASADAFRSLLAAARRGEPGRDTLAAAYTRVLALKAWLHPHWRTAARP